jgi:hypothetical protein
VVSCGVPIMRKILPKNEIIILINGERLVVFDSFTFLLALSG